MKNLVLEDDPILRKRGQLFDFNNPQEDPIKLTEELLDASGTDEFLKILNHLTGNQNVFIISHKGDVLFDKFKDIIKFEKYKNFSRIV